MRDAAPDTAEPSRVMETPKTRKPMETAPAMAETGEAETGVAVPIIRPVIVTGPAFRILPGRLCRTAVIRRKGITGWADRNRPARAGRKPAQDGGWRKRIG